MFQEQPAEAFIYKFSVQEQWYVHLISVSLAGKNIYFGFPIHELNLLLALNPKVLQINTPSEVL